MTLVARHIDSPIGTLTIVVSDDGVRALLMSTESPDRIVLGEDVEVGEHPLLDAAAAQLDEYFSGDRRDFDLPLDPRGSPFQLRAWQALCTIPYGETVSYGEQARRLGDVNKARAVGAANGRNPISIIVPCHRVIGSDGSLTGFGGGIPTKAWLLAHESNTPTLW